MKITHKVKGKDIYHTFEITKKDIIVKDFPIQKIGEAKPEQDIIYEFVECPICFEKIELRHYEKKYERIKKR